MADESHFVIQDNWVHVSFWLLHLEESLIIADSPVLCNPSRRQLEDNVAEERYYGPVFRIPALK